MSVAPRRGLPQGGTAASVADRRFRRADIKPARRRRVLQRVWQIGRVVVVLAGLVGIGVMTTSQVVGAGVLAVDTLDVRGYQRLTAGEVEALVGHVRGENLLLVDLDRFRADLLDSRWVADVTVRRVFPSTIAARVVERHPIAVARLGAQLYLVDDAGVIIDEFGPQYRDLDLPIVDGMAAPASADRPIDPGRAQLVARFMESLAGRPDVMRALSQVNVATAGNVIVLLGDDPTFLHLGDERFLERLQTYLELTPALVERGRTVDYVDLRFGNRVFLKDRQ